MPGYRPASASSSIGLVIPSAAAACPLSRRFAFFRSFLAFDRFFLPLADRIVVEWCCLAPPTAAAGVENARGSASPPAPCRAAGVESSGVAAVGVESSDAAGVESSDAAAAAAAPPCCTLGVEGPDVAASCSSRLSFRLSSRLSRQRVPRFAHRLSCPSCPRCGRFGRGISD